MDNKQWDEGNKIDKNRFVFFFLNIFNMLDASFFGCKDLEVIKIYCV